MTIELAVDEFVKAVNSREYARERESLPADEVPEFLRAPGGSTDGFTQWRIAASDRAKAVAALEETLQKRFPPSFRLFIARYSFPAFDCGPVTLFANTGQDVRLELSRMIFHDPAMSPRLLKGGFLQIGNPSGGDYDPVCFDLNSSRSEHRLVRLDHESILMGGELSVTEEIAPSFIDLMKMFRDART
jgi:hypothetical protein